MYILYIEQGCPYGDKVIRFMKENDISVELRDRDVPPHEANLVSRGGKRQTPYLVDEAHSVEMYESDKIIQYLRMRENA